VTDAFEKARVQLVFLMYDPRQDLRKTAAQRLRAVDPSDLQKLTGRESGAVLALIEQFDPDHEPLPHDCMYHPVPAEDYSSTSKANMPCAVCGKQKWS
jgi:hypothetical protein